MKTRIVHTKIYDDDWFNTLSIVYKMLFIYFFTNSRIGLTGIYQLSDRIIKFETGATPEQLQEAKTLFEKDRKIFFYKDWIYVVKSSIYGGYSGPKNAVAYDNEKEKLPKEIKKYFNNKVSIGYQYSSDTSINHKSEIINHKLKTINKKSKSLNEEIKETLNTPEDLKWKERFGLAAKRISQGAIILSFLLLPLIKPIQATTVSIHYQISFRPTRAYKLVVKESSSLLKPKISENQRGSGGSKIIPFPKLLTPQGKKNREKALVYLSKYYQGDELIAADNILKKEAGYRYDAVNEIGCAGMVQACPASKLGCPLTEDGILCQTQWFIGYLNRRYGSPTQAWRFHLQNNYY